jgi:ubiquinone/menaquinone biosynthesis C-methylase UbiE
MYLWVVLLGKLFHGDETPYKYLAASNETFPSPIELIKIYEKIGFKNITNKNYLFGQIAAQISKK